ncbi:MAG TPA: hypothetical protein VMZ52_20810 [Bryobacteraceae bacterium]|nr:hypothetical protein [Bryobacteraceae bacterium]
MFFRTKKLRVPAFDKYLEGLKDFGFQVKAEGSGHATVARKGCAAIVEDVPGRHPQVNKLGVLIGDEIGLLVNRGYQQFLRTESGRELPALATHLKALHAFEEDLKEGLGISSLYNESIGTTSDLHMYDRVRGRDAGVPARAWEKD